MNSEFRALYATRAYASVHCVNTSMNLREHTEPADEEKNRGTIFLEYLGAAAANLQGRLEANDLRLENSKLLPS
jgi:hypothetical protein